MKQLAASPESDFEYSLIIDEDTKTEGCVITKYTGTSAAVVIPETLNSVAVKRIARNAFAFNESLVSLTMPDCVTEIECGRYLDDIWWDPGAFDRCKNLAAVVLSNNLARIGGYAFYGCVSLTNIHIPATVGFIGEEAFSCCASLTSINLPNKINQIGVNAFFRCSSLKSIKIPDGVERIGGYVFYGCGSLAEIVIPDKVTRIGCFAFSECSSLISASISDNVAEIGEGAFKNCSKLKNVNIPKGLVKLGYEVFDGCASLTSLTIPDGVAEADWRGKLNQCENLGSISVGPGNPALMDIDGVLFRKDKSNILRDIIRCPGGKAQSSYAIPDGTVNLDFAAFYGCKNIKDVIIPASVKKTDVRSYYGCKRLVNIHVVGDNTKFSDEDGILYDKSKSELIRYPAGREENTFAIPDGVIRIGDFAFNGCEKLESIIIPSSVTEIGGNAFQYCENLKSITIPDSVTKIGGQAFRHCETLASIVIPDSVADIGVRVFEFCKNLADITLSNSIRKISERMFKDCISLASITIPNNVRVVEESAFGGCQCLKSARIGCKLIDINIIEAFKGLNRFADIFVDSKNTAFSDADGVLFNKDKSVLLWFPEERERNAYVIPSSVISIGDRAFCGCKNLESIIIPDSVADIGNGAFENCKNLMDIIIPDSVTHINGNAFDLCSSITEIFIPNSVAQVDGRLSFKNCGNLVNITVDAENAVLSDVDGVLFNKGLTELIRYPEGKTKDAYVIPDTVTQIGARAFYGCKNLTCIVVPNSVTTINDNAFFGCDNITDITIPSTAENISEDMLGFSTWVDVRFSLTIHTAPGSAACGFAEKKNLKCAFVPF